MLIDCLHCNKPFQKRHSLHKFCNRSCYTSSEHRKKIVHNSEIKRLMFCFSKSATCPICETLFMKRSTKIYCSLKCKKRAFMRRKNGLPIIYEKLCKRCQTPFKLTLLNSKHSYCSPKCRIDARRDNDKRSKDKAKGKLADPRPQVPLYKTVLVQSAYDNWNRRWDALMKINSPQLKKILLEIEVRIPL